MPITEKRVSLSIDGKLWILNHRKENPKITQNKIALDFSLWIFQKNDRLEADTELERKRIKIQKIIVGGNDEEEMVTLELILENEDQKLPKNLKFSLALHNFSK